MSSLPADILDRMVIAVERVRERLLRATAALDRAGIAYAVCGGNAIAAWVATVDDSAIRNTQDVDVMLRRTDLPKAIVALSAAGFIYRHAAGLDIFLDGPDGKPRQGVQVVFAGEYVREGELAPNPDVTSATQLGALRVLTLEALVTIKLTAFRDKDRTHLLDMIELGMLGSTWNDRLSPPLAARLQSLLDDPNG
jgi:hypothetical protein